MDAGGCGDDAPCAPEDPASFLEEVAASRSQAYDGVGMGRDVRLSAPRIAGGGLVLERRVVHLCAFRVEDRGGVGGWRRQRGAEAGDT